MQADRSNNHYHTDPKIINQIGIGLYSPGQLLYLDTDGIYKLAIATSRKTSQIIGIVWQIYAENRISIRVEPTPLFYEHPLGPEWFEKDINNEVLKEQPLNSKIPGNIGNMLWLSETIEGGLQSTYPVGEHKTIVGYKTKNGFIFRPERLFCCPEV